MAKAKAMIRLWKNQALGDLELVETTREALSENPHGVEVRSENGRRTLFPWTTVHSVTWEDDG